MKTGKTTNHLSNAYVYNVLASNIDECFKIECEQQLKDDILTVTDEICDSFTAHKSNRYKKLAKRSLAASSLNIRAPRLNQDATFVDSYGNAIHSKREQFSYVVHDTDLDPNYPASIRKPQIDRGNYDFCGHLPDSGVWCTGVNGDLPPSSLHFYYDDISRECRCFYYNGCDGNANNFISPDLCYSICFRNRSENDTIPPLLTDNKLRCLYYP
ncbi:hypothetical protein B4U80_13752 [Leptotrombidium deliense]|uniref:BPTI/Kunitz inhibitor domain-containing protein n=1 Tax=Leptotrombidium deliense TaxID=299467 RepID=A0A443SGR1_9ACAR|nr:hypothetical protein B4U80_13752 [Leptotrombidium deliense]